VSRQHHQNICIPCAVQSERFVPAGLGHSGGHTDRAIKPVTVNQHFGIGHARAPRVAGIGERTLAGHTEEATTGVVNPGIGFADTNRRIESVLVIVAKSCLGRAMGIYEQGNIETAITANGCPQVTPFWPQPQPVF